ncbi:dihydrodipicolinate synthase family protein [Paenibacillus radicis (ex Xue et al. 2023)]|uniref:Dihydrodipicolinate synthase family protein n=1 Tax=Paenibacillus radicis (ex Xue et al. 2023) TaxID=2972489 RepID=A0ABT1YUS9_9BACL|nr:dihydrodipicolinate synthase family protein [Paenibacillus radicis (ex Xue et al. 2023)]MCR8636345.1 dihydrodipicolinate synthase family protein [Paenibacillus radicis (ex Xue et al. 2023)]
MKHLYGVTTAMVTPFDENGKVDLGKVEQIAEFLISKGVHCLYPLGTTGEMLRMSVEERKAVAEAVVKKANKRVTVYIHTGAMNEEDTIALSKHAYEIGADGIGVVSPVFFLANDKELETYFVNVASSVPDNFPMYLYGIPQLAGNDIKPEVAQRVADRCKNVIGFKYSYPDYLRVNEYLAVNEGKFSVVPGADKLFLPGLAMGCDGVVSGVSCAYPEPFVAVYNAFIENDIIKARKMQRIAIKYCELLKNGSNMSYYKEALKLRGIEAGFMRAPQLDLTPEEVEALGAALQELNEEASELFA